MIINNISIMIGKRKYTIAEVARIAGVDYNTVSNLYYDKTKSIGFETLDKLCYALECTPNDLLTYVENK